MLFNQLNRAFCCLKTYSFFSGFQAGGCVSRIVREKPLQQNVFTATELQQNSH